MQQLLQILVVAFLLSGCGSSQQQQDALNEQKVTEALPRVDQGPPSKEEGLLVTYTTGEDNAQWPNYNMPLIHELPVPEVPERIRVPAEKGALKETSEE
jgi:hypothetical protein